MAKQHISLIKFSNLAKAALKIQFSHIPWIKMTKKITSWLFFTTQHLNTNYISQTWNWRMQPFLWPKAGHPKLWPVFFWTWKNLFNEFLNLLMATLSHSWTGNIMMFFCYTSSPLRGYVGFEVHLRIIILLRFYLYWNQNKW